MHLLNNTVVSYKADSINFTNSILTFNVLISLQILISDKISTKVSVSFTEAVKTITVVCLNSMQLFFLITFAKTIHEKQQIPQTYSSGLPD